MTGILHSPLIADEMTGAPTVRSAVAASSLSAHPLRVGQEAEVLAFLGQRPLHTVVMAGHILDNGLESPLNRGSFHACRDLEGKLEGVALIGHATLLETRSDPVLACFAHLAQRCPTTHMIMGEREKIDRFWQYYANRGQSPRHVGRELMLEKRGPVETHEPMRALRLATLEDLEQIMSVQAEMAFASSGINPLEADPEGFRARCARRIERQRIWVWVSDNRLIFKADVISQTPQVVYLEGIYVNPQDRNRGYGARCMSQLGQNLLNRRNSLCIFVNEESRRARAFFERTGFRVRSYYHTVFIAPRSARIAGRDSEKNCFDQEPGKEKTT